MIDIYRTAYTNMVTTTLEVKGKFMNIIYMKMSVR